MLEFKNFSFRYEGIKDNIVSDISFTVNKGEIALLCGKSGSGKSTLVRSIKPMYNQKGQSSGEILYNGKNVKELSMKELSKIGYISQDIENQIVTDKVWHELSFGLENLGLKNSEIRLRCGEMAAYFGIESWYNKKTSDLSTGQKQLLNLASVMIMRPDILVLDEPVSTLDPVAASEILERIFKLNRDFGTTILIVMHELEEIYAMVSKVIFIDQKAVVMPAREMANYMLRNNNDQVKALPQSARICGLLNRRENKEITKDAQVPISIAQGRDFVENNKELLDKLNAGLQNYRTSANFLQLRNSYFGKLK